MCFTNGIGMHKGGTGMKVFWVSKRLAFGSAVTTWGHVEQLQALGITHVINLRHGKHSKKVREFKNLWLPFRDDKEPRPRRFYRQALRFYQKAMRTPNTKVLCICHHGVSRSPSLAYFLLREDGLSIAEAKSTVLKARPQARIVPAYWRSGEDFRSLYTFQQLIRGTSIKSRTGVAT
jgi:protein-tyrosine phosphatase